MQRNKPLRIAYFSPTWPPGTNPNGIVGYVDNVRRGLDTLGVESRVLALDGADETDVVRGSFRRLGAVARATQWACYRALPNDAFLLQTIVDGAVAARRLRRQWPFDLFEIEETRGGSQWIRAAVGAPAVVRLHGPWFLSGEALGLPKDAEFHQRVRHEGVGIRKATAISAPSRDVLKRTREYYGLELPHAQVIPNPGPHPDPNSAWSHERREPNRLLVVGRFDRHKGGDVIVDALALLLQKRPDVRLTFVGPDIGFLDDAGRRWSFEEYVASRLPAHQRSSIDMLGRMDHSQIAGLRQRASIVISPSRYDNFPLAVLEAAAQGCPVICSDKGGSAEIVESGVNGLVFQSGNAADLAAQAMILLGNPELAADYGAKLRSTYDHRYLPEVVAKPTLEFYAEVCARHGHARIEAVA